MLTLQDKQSLQQQKNYTGKKKKKNKFSSLDKLNIRLNILSVLKKKKKKPTKKTVPSKGISLLLANFISFLAFHNWKNSLDGVKNPPPPPKQVALWLLLSQVP